MLKALESGQIVDIIAKRISQKKKEHAELEKQILIESMQHPMPTINEIKFFLDRFRKGDINNIKYRQALIDSL